ncbi:MAG: hypothetical protein HYV28_13565 [Ignavibacteriales bacterium]|nr:hypothetical protein [Ignavibacteriales bacterium]
MILEESELARTSAFTDFNYEYAGVCDNKFLVTFTEYLSANFELVMSPKEFKTVLFCANEMLQNIGFYSFEREALSDSKDTGKGKFSLKCTGSEIVIYSENQIDPEQHERLAAKLQMYNALNADELKALYKQMIKTESPEDSKGGGIGFIEMIRKSKNPIIYMIRKAENTTYISFQITIRR